MEENKKYSYNDKYHFPIENMDSDDFITDRLNKVDLSEAGQKAYENILRFLYETEHDGKVARATNKRYLDYLSNAEKIILFRLETRCSGSQRHQYGINSVIAVKRAKYQCEICGEKDIRCLEIDHINGRKKPNEGSKHVKYEIDEFQCLCANHHRIKTVLENQQN